LLAIARCLLTFPDVANFLYNRDELQKRLVAWTSLTPRQIRAEFTQVAIELGNAHLPQIIL
jgi:hypothetical protein